MGICPQQPSRAGFCGGTNVSSLQNDNRDPSNSRKRGRWRIHLSVTGQRGPGLDSTVDRPKGCRQLRHSWPCRREPSAGGSIQGLVLESPQSFQSDSGSTGDGDVPLRNYFAFRPKVPICKAGMVLPPSIILRSKGNGVCKAAQRGAQLLVNLPS